MEIPTFDHSNQDPFLDSEHTIKEVILTIKNLRMQSNPGQGRIGNLLIHSLPKEAFFIHSDRMLRVFLHRKKYRNVEKEDK
jgi:hypothetical protein